MKNGLMVNASMAWKVQIGKFGLNSKIMDTIIWIMDNSSGDGASHGYEKKPETNHL